MTDNDFRVVARWTIRHSRHFLAIERRKPCKLLAVDAKDPSLLFDCCTELSVPSQPKDLKIFWLKQKFNDIGVSIFTSDCVVEFD